ncbi:MAG: prepilin-type N-terminal cleavage/methylation domain-containing protein [Myxococcota bacterium]|jgi:Tfp pilus assembly protein PilV|nr:prepilin-type N-terminal cleavage/methylation domain-containing protein [Myxococcota bacterium]
MAQLKSAMRSSRTHRRASRQGGFSLIEVTLAFTILGVGLLALAGAQLGALQGNQSGRHLSQGALVAQNQLEQLVGRSWTALVPVTWTAPITISTVIDDGQGGATEQDYQASWLIQDVIVGETRSIDIRITWTEPSGRARSVAASTLRFNRENL